MEEKKETKMKSICRYGRENRNKNGGYVDVEELRDACETLLHFKVSTT